MVGIWFKVVEYQIEKLNNFSNSLWGIFLFLWVVLEFELRASCLQVSHAYLGSRLLVLAQANLDHSPPILYFVLKLG
jgi:hypothetical protein